MASSVKKLFNITWVLVFWILAKHNNPMMVRVVIFAGLSNHLESANVPAAICRL
jgi:hypothetical protein